MDRLLSMYGPPSPVSRGVVARSAAGDQGRGHDWGFPVPSVSFLCDTNGDRPGWTPGSYPGQRPGGGACQGPGLHGIAKTGRSASAWMVRLITSVAARHVHRATRPFVFLADGLLGDNMRYALLVCGDEGAVISPEDRARGEAAAASLQDELRATSILLGAERLCPTTTAATVQVWGGDVMVARGPFAGT